MATTQVIVYFDSPTDALRFTLAASSALAGDGKKSKDHPDLSREIKRAARILAEERYCRRVKLALTGRRQDSFPD